MPHPERAIDAAARRYRRPDHVPLAARGAGMSAIHHARDHRRARPRPEEYERILCDPRPRAEPGRARHLLGDVERALLLQVLQDPPRQVPDQGALGRPRTWRERRRGRHRRRPGRGLQDGEPQPPVLHRALPGRGDRRRRHPPRHLHHGRAARRAPGLAALRRPEPPQDAPPARPAWSPASAATATASACRPWAASAPSTAPTTATSWSTPSASASPAPTGCSTPRPAASGTR